MDIFIIGIDLGKNSCSLAGLDTSSRVVLRRRRASSGPVVRRPGARSPSHVEDPRTEWRVLDERIAAFDAEFVRMARNDEAVRRLTTILGIGTINATALAAAVGNAQAFRRGRDMAAWLGLTPRQMTTGGKPRLLD